MDNTAEVRFDRPSGAVLALLIVYGFFAALMAAGAVTHGSPLALLPITAFIAVPAGIGWRWARMAVIADATGLTVRNLMTTHHVARRRVRDFRLGGSRFEYPGRAIRVVVEDGSTIVLAATGRYYRQTPEHEAQLAALRNWLRRSAPKSESDASGSR
jgi:cell division protein FtsW (lipid II flippase)